MTKKDEVIGKECRHITYCVSEDGNDDALFIKEWLHMADGRKVPNLKMIENMERDFYVVKPARRTYKDKIQYIAIDDCNKHSCRELDLLRKADLALGGSGFVKTKQQLFKNPYLFGCGVKPQSLIKNAYNTKWPDFRSPTAIVAMADTETDVLNGTEEIIMASVTLKEEAYLLVDRNFFNGTPDEIILQRLKNKASELIGNVLSDRNIKLYIQLFNNAGEIAYNMVQICHRWKPDFVSFWNMNFDIQKMIDALVKYGYNPAKVFSDESVPDKYKFFRYKEGAATKVIHDGSEKNLNFEQRWHVAECPATFFLIDAMTLYYRLRMAGGMEESYNLDEVLYRNVKITKLKIDEIDHLTGIDWHKEMQTNYKYEYCIYNVFDSISLEILDEETNDISIKLPALCQNSDYTDFKSDPKKTADDMHYHALKHGYVMGVIDGDIRDENDKFIVTPDDWIITLPSYLSYGLGVPVLSSDEETVCKTD